MTGPLRAGPIVNRVPRLRIGAIVRTPAPSTSGGPLYPHPGLYPRAGLYPRST